jgi:hypothetical protein
LYEFVFKGKRYHKSTRVKNERDARTIANAAYTALAKGEVGIVERKPAPTLKGFRISVAVPSSDRKRSRACSPPGSSSHFRFKGLLKVVLDRAVVHNKAVLRRHASLQHQTLFRSTYSLRSSANIHLAHAISLLASRLSLSGGDSLHALSAI